ncbi:hypothetical protein CDL15_Pgr006200 [Punica granatum]|uniref:Senescence-specific cysteine protease SAG39-like n=1 Tax=Punica granatum TaxID=22663 RepID=A0A218XF64_PUNGR|nr:hypothetical protein CDL15_Pgr006200 [Punica granatum]
MLEKHEQWMSQFGRVYANETEKQTRFAIFKSNLEYIESVNRDGSKPYRLGLNAFADLTNEEFRTTRTGYKPSFHSKSSVRTPPFRYENISEIPPSMDWRQKGAVTPIKYQGNCGCCWAFSAVAAVEGIHQLSTGSLTSLSEQELVDCVADNYGCKGGWMDTAFKYIIQNNGLTTEDNYPYLAVDGTCDAGKASSPAATITGYEDVPANSESALLNAVAKQPVSVALEGSGKDFQFYSSGVFMGECGTELTHAVTVVGYGIGEDGTKYWLIKNSWGTTWGEEGYMRIAREIDAAEGLCGIAKKASYPTAA